MIYRILIAWIGNLIDTVATVQLYTRGLGVEINPLSAWLLRCPVVFVVVKMALMSIAVWSCWRERRRKVFQVASWVLCTEYLAVAAYYAVAWHLLWYAPLI